jgi:tight adherence protein C
MKYLQSLLPIGLQGSDGFFIIIAVGALLIFTLVGKSFAYHNKFAVRVKALQDRRAQLRADLMAPRRRTRKTGPTTGINLMRDTVNKLNLLQKSQIGKINHLLVNAGYRSKDAIFIFTFFQLVCPIIALAVAMAVSKIDLAAPFASKWKPVFVMGMAYVGFKLPGVLVINACTKRYYAIQKSLSDMLDLMMICAEAGLSLAASLDRVARELGGTYPEMAEELALTSIEIGFLPDRKRALSNLAERVDMPEIRGIVGVLIQTEKYGTPIAQALRVLAGEFRTQRMLRAEQKAARLPAIMTVPMILFILPTLFIVVLAPAMIKLSDTWH